LAALGVVLMREWIPVISGKRKERFLVGVSRSFEFILPVLVIPKSLKSWLESLNERGSVDMAGFAA
jgi:hypothetical protein